jgi:hypothetical protein
MSNSPDGPERTKKALAFFGIEWEPEEMWELADLTPSQRAELDEYSVSLRARCAVERPGDEWWTPGRLYHAALWDMGIHCDHPKEYRSGWPSDADLEKMCDGIEGALFYEKAIRRAWECGACGLMTMISQRDDIDVAVFVGGPRGGERSVIPKDAVTWEVPVPPELTFGPPSESASPTATLQTVTYRRTGRHVSFGREFVVA